MPIRQSFTNHFLIAMPNMADPHFVRSVTYICQHNDEGAMGIQINRLSDIRLGEVFTQMELTALQNETNAHPIFIGGPVQPERGFVLHDSEQKYESSFRIGQSLSVTTSRDILIAMANSKGPSRSLIALGYAGWTEGQLEQEILSNSWLTVPADKDIIFNTPIEHRWESAAALIGIHPNQLTGLSGRA